MAIIYAGIVLYNPDISLLKKNIEAIRNQVAKVALVDNGSDNIAEVQSLINKYENACLISNDDNLGIAKALNQIMERAKEENAQWVLTLDQDSICPDGMVKKYQAYINDNVGMICPRLNIVGWNLEEVNNYPGQKKLMTASQVEPLLTSKLGLLSAVLMKIILLT